MKAWKPALGYVDSNKHDLLRMLWSQRGCTLCAGRTFNHYRTTFGRTGRSDRLPFEIFMRDRQTRTMVWASVQ